MPDDLVMANGEFVRWAVPVSTLKTPTDLTAPASTRTIRSRVSIGLGARSLAAVYVVASTPG
jgi:hypothetical protein